MFDLKYHKCMKQIDKFHNDINSEKNKYNKAFMTKCDLHEEHYKLMRDLDIDSDTFTTMFISMRMNRVYFAKYPLSTLNKQLKQLHGNAKASKRGINCMV